MPIFGAILALVQSTAFQSILERIFPDPRERDKAIQGLLAQLQQTDAAMLEVNKIEAQSPSIFVSGWRPYIAWVCGLGMTWTFLLQPFAAWCLVITNHPIPLPVLDTAPLYALVVSMLGLGTFRMAEKIEGVARR